MYIARMQNGMDRKDQPDLPGVPANGPVSMQIFVIPAKHWRPGDVFSFFQQKHGRHPLYFL
jgi:transposase InsO family protein